MQPNPHPNAEYNHYDWEVERVVPAPQFALLRDMLVEPGSKEDWEALHELHYKSTSKTWGRYYKVTLDGELIAICVMTSPRPLLTGRHEAFPQIKPGSDTKIINTYRYKWLNQNMCLNSRTVVDTMYRGIGVAYRLLNLAARMEGKRFAEIQSSMSRYNFFAQKAGFRFTQPRVPGCYGKALMFFYINFKASPVDFVALVEEFEALSEPRQQVILRKMRQFYFRHSALEKTGKNRDKGTTRVDAMDFKELLKNLQQLAFAMPMYGVYENPDYKFPVPTSIPLIAFDNQATDEPLRLDK